jgi:flagellar biosynthesis/type III secretory pathway M-ring protein FliF/YscJ
MASLQDDPASDPKPLVMESTHVQKELTSAVTVDTESGTPAVNLGEQEEQQEQQEQENQEQEDYDYNHRQEEEDYEYNKKTKKKKRCVMCGTSCVGRDYEEWRLCSRKCMLEEMNDWR